MLTAGIIITESLVEKVHRPGASELILDWKKPLLTEKKPPQHGEDGNFLPDFYSGQGLGDLLVFAFALAVIVVLAKTGAMTFDWALFSQVSLLVVGVALTSALVLSLCEPFLRSMRQLRSTMLAAAIVMIVVAMSALLAQQALVFAMLKDQVDLGVVVDMVVLAVAPVGVSLRYFSVKQKMYAQKNAAREAGVKAHQASIRPHFLYNALNVIASLIVSDPEKAERATEDLSELFRDVMTGSPSLIPLREELSLCRRYIALEKLRLEERLEVEWQIADYGEDVKIPSLTLQPVLENAVYHGIQLLPRGGKIEIRIRRTGDWVHIDVQNPRNPRLQHNKGHKMAMKNVRYRLRAHFGPSARVESEVTESHYTTHISFPVKVYRL